MINFTCLGLSYFTLQYMVAFCSDDIPSNYTKFSYCDEDEKVLMIFCNGAGADLLWITEGDVATHYNQAFL